MEFLSAEPSRSFKVREIAAAMRDVNSQTLTTAIGRLKESQKIVKVERGQYRVGIVSMNGGRNLI
jgi:predicted transcriptional regulator of viral defense system